MANPKNAEVPATTEVEAVDSDEVSTDDEVAETTTPDSKIVEMAGMVLSGTVFTATNEDGTIDLASIVAFRNSFGKFLTGLKGVAKNYDEQLVTLRQVHGADYLTGVEYFRKPRESKSSGNSLLDNLRL